jgi:hypothetical protein
MTKDEIEKRDKDTLRDDTTEICFVTAKQENLLSKLFILFR